MQTNVQKNVQVFLQIGLYLNFWIGVKFLFRFWIHFYPSPNSRFPSSHNISFDMKTAKSGSSSTSSQNPLSFKARLKIARGIARGIAFIHDKKHVHGNIKPNNILFDSEFEPMIADTGLNRLMTSAHSLIAVPTSGSHHHPPEWSTCEKPNPKWDVYSFGVVFLELLIGRVFLVDRDFVRDSEVDEKTWFLRLVDGTISSDVAHHEDEVVACFRLSYSCVSSLPQKRPSMKDVVQVLEKISV